MFFLPCMSQRLLVPRKKFSVSISSLIVKPFKTIVCLVEILLPYSWKNLVCVPNPLSVAPSHDSIGQWRFIGLRESSTLRGRASFLRTFDSLGYEENYWQLPTVGKNSFWWNKYTSIVAFRTGHAPKKGSNPWVFTRWCYGRKILKLQAMKKTHVIFLGMLKDILYVYINTTKYKYT